MARPALPIGAYGNISVKQLADTKQGVKRFRATARFRDPDGTTRPVEAVRETKSKAINALKEMFVERVNSGGGDITRDTKISALADMWIDEVILENKVTTQTIQSYKDEIGPSDSTDEVKPVTIKDSLGNLRVWEASTSRIDKFLKQVGAQHPAKARKMKAILSGMMGLAVRHDAIPANPVRETAGIRATSSDPRALSLDQLEALRTRVRLWMTGAQMPEDERPRQKGGQPRNQGLLDVVDVMLATGARIGEVLALRWADLDLGASPAECAITGTVIPVKGEGLRRQEFPKGKKTRVVLLPSFAVETLMRVQMTAVPNEWDVVFPSDRGTLRSPHNFRRMWRDARGAEWKWVTPHSFRKTVATLVERERGMKAASTQMGHAGEAVTAKHYVQKRDRADDVTDVLERLGGRGES